MIYVIATLTVRPEKRADFLENARTVIAATHKEPGCLSYDLQSSVTEPNLFVFSRAVESRDALAAHFEAPHLKAWREISREFVDSAKIEIVHPETVEEL